MSASFFPERKAERVSVSGVSMVRNLQVEVPGHLVTEEVRDLPQQHAKLVRRSFPATHERELVLDQRMIDDGDVLH